MQKIWFIFESQEVIFHCDQGKILGHIVSKDGVKIDLERVETIKVINLPRHKQEVQSFYDKINFLRRFIPNFANIVKDIANMLKRGKKLNGPKVARASFR
jgi:hypothetical protein